AKFEHPMKRRALGRLVTGLGRVDEFLDDLDAGARASVASPALLLLDRPFLVVAAHAVIRDRTNGTRHANSFLRTPGAASPPRFSGRDSSAATGQRMKGRESLASGGIRLYGLSGFPPMSAG